MDESRMKRIAAWNCTMAVRKCSELARKKYREDEYFLARVQANSRLRTYWDLGLLSDEGYIGFKKQLLETHDYLFSWEHFYGVNAKGDRVDADASEYTTCGQKTNIEIGKMFHRQIDEEVDAYRNANAHDAFEIL